MMDNLLDSLMANRATRMLKSPLNTPDRAALDHARRMENWSWAGLSREIGMEASYLHTWFTKGSPRVLHERHRKILADILKIDEDLLRAEDDLPLSASRSAPKIIGPDDANRHELPVYHDPADVRSGNARSRELRPVRVPDRGLVFGLYVSGHHGRLRPGDLIYVKQDDLTRGDTVVVLKDSTIEAIGDLATAPAAKLTIRGDGKKPDQVIAVTEKTRVLKVACIIPR